MARKMLVALLPAVLAAGIVVGVLGGTASEADAHPQYQCTIVGYEWVTVNGSYLDYWKPIYKCVGVPHEHVLPNWMMDLLWLVGQGY